MSEDNADHICPHYNFPFIKYFLRHRKIYLWGTIEEHNTLFIVSALLYLADKNKDPIYLYINSDGGDCHQMAAIFDTMEKVKNDGITIYTICVGEACSAAAFLLMNGSDGSRIASPNSSIMIHQLEYSLDLDSAGKNKKYTEFVHQQNENFIELMATMCKKTTNAKLRKFKEDISGGDLWFTAKEAQKYGIVDSVSDI